MAVVGKNFAVLEAGWLRTGGFLTWLVWAALHVLALPQLQNRFRVQTQWFWSYLTGATQLAPDFGSAAAVGVIAASRPGGQLLPDAELVRDCTCGRFHHLRAGRPHRTTVGGLTSVVRIG